MFCAFSLKIVLVAIDMFISREYSILSIGVKCLYTPIHLYFRICVSARSSISTIMEYYEKLEDIIDFIEALEDIVGTVSIIHYLSNKCNNNE